MAQRKKRDYYEVLGVDRKANADDIKKAFRSLAKVHHPDRATDKSEGSDAMFKEISEAYEVLSDPQKRSAYDQFGADGPQGFSGQGQGFQDFSFNDVFEDFFGGMFGQGNRGQRSQATNQASRGEDILTKVFLDFIDAIVGKKMSINIDVQVGCEECNQTGARSAHDVQNCGHCKGAGFENISQRTPFGMVNTQRICPKCQGVGKIITQPCMKCKGNKFYVQNQKLEFDIPRGIFPGQQIRIKGKGRVGRNGGMQGDLYIEVGIKPHAFFKRDGYNIYLTLPVSYLDAILGNMVSIPTIEGTVRESLPSGVQNGHHFLLKGKGCYYSNKDKRGDLIAIIDVKYPAKVSKTEKEELRQVWKNTKFDPNKEFIDQNIKKA